jgi:hypothetical protein
LKTFDNAGGVMFERESKGRVSKSLGTFETTAFRMTELLICEEIDKTILMLSCETERGNPKRTPKTL